MRVLLVLCGVCCLCACEREGGHMRAAVPELSGMVKSRRHEGVFWAHGDSGNAPELWAIDATGRTRGRFEVKAQNHDWEDIAIDDAGNLYIGDIGDNFKLRDDLTILRVREPATLSDHGVMQVAATQPFRYPNTTRGKPQQGDSEAIFFASGRLYLLSKARFSTESTLYRFPSLFTGKTTILERVGTFDLRAMKDQGAAPVTAADVSADATRLAIMTYRHVYVFRFDGATLRERLFLSRLPDERGYEALAFDRDHLLLGREGGDLRVLPLPRIAQPERRAP